MHSRHGKKKWNIFIRKLCVSAFVWSSYFLLHAYSVLEFKVKLKVKNFRTKPMIPFFCVVQLWLMQYNYCLISSFIPQ